METLINFRSLASQLNEQEMQIFLTKLIATPNIYPLIISSIFDHFARQIVKSKAVHSDQITHITNIISQLIESRIYKSNKDDNDVKPAIKTAQQPASVPAIKIDDFAPELISVISSFLSQKEYISFQMSNRKILIGCNSPCSLRTYYSACFRNPVTININKCASIKHLSIDTSSNTQRDRLNVVQTMKNMFNINFNRITRFSCGSFGQYSADNCRLFIAFLAKFVNLRYLDMVDVFAAHQPFERSYVPPSFSQLRGMSLILNEHYGNPWYDKMMEMYSNQITSFCCNSQVISMCSGYKFSKLKELKVGMKMYGQIQPFLQNTNLLEIVSIHFDDTHSIHDRFSVSSSKKEKIEEMKRIMKEVFKTQQKLEYFEIKAKQKWFHSIIDSMKTALDNEMTMGRDVMKLQITLQDNRKDSSMDWVDAVASIVDVLNLLNDVFDVNNWMFGCTYIRKHNNVLFDGKDKIFGHLEDKYLVNHFQQDKKFKFVISNKANQMNGGYGAHGVYVV